MGVKHNVRMRRMERIKQIREVEDQKSEQQDFPISTDSEQNVKPAYIERPLPEKKLPVLERTGPYLEPSLHTVSDPRLQDPEYVWKQKYKTGLFEHDDDPSDDVYERPWLLRFWIKGVICLAIFILVWGLFQIRHPFAEKGKSYVINALTNPLEFDAVTTWFKDTFGDTPSFLPVFRSDQRQEETIKASIGNKRTYFAPLQGYITIPFDQSKTGVLLQTKTGASVSSFDEGQIVFVGTTEETGLTVNIKHPNGVQTTYGWLEKSQVVMNDWVKGGDTIGFASENERKGTGLLYFSIKLDKTYVNPVEVISFD